MIGSFFLTNGITMVCLVYIILVILMYYVKGKARGFTSKIYFFLLMITLLAMLTYMTWGLFAVNSHHLANIFAKISVFVICCWNFTLAYYMFITFKQEYSDESNYKKHMKSALIMGAIVYLINLILVVILDMNTIQIDRIYSMEGTLHTYVGVTGIIAVLFAIIALIVNRKKLDKTTQILSTTVVIIIILSMLMSMTGAVKINDIAFLHTVVVMFLYLSIESQDKALLEEFNESNKKAKEQNQLKSEFIMNMSHQLRTPMNTILGFSDSLLASEVLYEGEFIDDTLSIETASKKLLELITSILDISKLESDKEVINNEDYTLDSIIYDISSNINSKINKENVTFYINANSNCPNDLNGDAYKIAKILNIILSNVVLNTEYGEISLNVSSSVVDVENHEFTFHIKNTGTLKENQNINLDLENLMKLNHEGDSDIDPEVLKMIIAKGLLKLMNGTIEYINQVGQGVQYIIKIKQKVTTQNELGNIQEKIQTRFELSQVKLNLETKKFLIIDDKKINTIVLERLLKQYKVDIEDTTNPRDGIDKATNTTYDLIFINHEMEEMSGEEVVKKLELTGNKLPPIIGLITGTKEIIDIKNYTDIIECPIDYKKLNKLIKKIFSNNQ